MIHTIALGPLYQYSIPCTMSFISRNVLELSESEYRMNGEVNCHTLVQYYYYAYGATECKYLYGTNPNSISNLTARS
jgi:hypothetical protein